MLAEFSLFQSFYLSCFEIEQELTTAFICDKKIAFDNFKSSNKDSLHICFKTRVN
jgi:hypothetical protein